jgi:membrane protein implicated in regulation of membrane protease activity
MLLVLAILLAILVLEEPWTWVVVLGGAAFELAEAAFLIWWSKRRKAVVGAETLIGRTAVVVADCMPAGQVRIGGELWQARCGPGAEIGDEVVIRALDGLTLVVEPS